MKYAVLLAIIIFGITSCNLGSETSEMSGNSSIRNEGIGYRMIVSNNHVLHKTTIYPDVVSHAYNKNFIIAKQKPQKSSWLVFLGFDLYRRYTAFSEYKRDTNIFRQYAWQDLKGKIEWDSINYQLFLKRGASTENSSSDMYVSSRIADSLIDNDPHYQKIFAHEFNYWIIWNAKDSLIGPLTKNEYLVKRKALHIPDDLELEE